MAGCIMHTTGVIAAAGIELLLDVEDGGNLRGFSNNTFSLLGSSFGSLEPATFKGAIIAAIVTNDSNTDLFVIFNGTRDKDFFTSFKCSLGTFLSADASHTQGAGPPLTTRWTWSGQGDFAIGEQRVKFL